MNETQEAGAYAPATLVQRGLLIGLEVETQAELHAAIGSKHATIDAEGALGQGSIQVEWAVVKADVIAHVIDLGSKLQLHFLVQIPTLGERGIYIEVPIAAEVVALAGLTGIRQANGCPRGDAIVDGV